MTDLSPAEEPQAETPLEEIVPEQPSEPEVEAPEATTPPEEPPAPATAEAETPPDDKSLPYWARQRVKAEKERARALEREVEALRQQRPAQPATAMPDPYEDPEGFYRVVTAQANQVAFNNHLNTCEVIARDRHGDGAVDEMLEWLGARPDLQQWSLSQRDPYRAAMTAYQREKIADEIGEDPNKWREAERERIRQEVLAEAGGQPQQPQRPFIPGPASTQRSARPANGQWTGPTPINSALKNNF